VSSPLVERLDRRHIKDHFTCGEPELDIYLRQYARQDDDRHLSRTYILRQDSSFEVRGYYSLSTASFRLSSLPGDIGRRLGRYRDVPAWIIGRLATHQDDQGKGWGSFLLFHALETIVDNPVAGAIIIVDAMNGAARRFYEHYGFQLLSNEPDTSSAHEIKRLFLPTATAAKAVATGKQNRS